MKAILKNDEHFLKLLKSFTEYPRVLPELSVIIVSENNLPIALQCYYYDSDIIFIHGLFKSSVSTKKDFVKAVKFIEKFTRANFDKKYSMISFTDKNIIGRSLLNNGFTREQTHLYMKVVS
jgi:hypothetical protein